MDKRDKILEITAQLWNEFLTIPNNEKHPDDTNDFRFHIHAIQNIIFTQKYKNQQATFEIKGSDLVAIFENTISNNKDYR